jgi:hypothetical protein
MNRLDLATKDSSTEDHKLKNRVPFADFNGTVAIKRNREIHR